MGNPARNVTSEVGRLSFQVGASAKQVITVDLPDFWKAGPITNLVKGR